MSMSRRSIRASAPLLEELRFADDAKLFLGEADPDSVEGIANPSSAYALEAAW